MAPMSQEAVIELLQSMVEKQSVQIQDQNETIKELRATIANLEETIREFQRKLFGRSSEIRSSKELLPEKEETETEENKNADKKTTTVASHERKCRTSRKDLYKDIPIMEVKIDVKDEKRFCPDCNAPMQHLGYKYVREEFRIIPAKVLRIHYYKETLYCPSCRQEDDSCIVSAEVPSALIKHSPASPSIVASIIYEKYMMYSQSFLPAADRLELPWDPAFKSHHGPLVHPVYAGISGSGVRMSAQTSGPGEVSACRRSPMPGTQKKGRKPLPGPICGSI